MEPMVVMAANAAKKVGHEILRAHQNRHRLDLAVESKGLDGLVTQIDRYAEELTIATLKESYPNHSYLGEEFGLQEGKGHDADWCWVAPKTLSMASHIFVCLSLSKKMASLSMV